VLFVSRHERTTLAICNARNETQTNIRSPNSFQHTFSIIVTCRIHIIRYKRKIRKFIKEHSGEENIVTSCSMVTLLMSFTATPFGPLGRGLYSTSAEATPKWKLQHKKKIVPVKLKYDLVYVDEYLNSPFDCCRLAAS